LFWPDDELTIQFSEMSLEVEDRDDGRVRMRPYCLEVFDDDE
jgi:hypothetical protein